MKLTEFVPKSAKEDMIVVCKKCGYKNATINEGVVKCPNCDKNKE